MADQERKTAKRTAPKEGETRTLSKWQDLRGDLERFVSKHEYRTAQPISDEEATSYRRAFEVMAGRQSLFGNDLRHGEVDVAGERGANALSAC